MVHETRDGPGAALARLALPPDPGRSMVSAKARSRVKVRLGEKQEYQIPLLPGSARSLGDAQGNLHMGRRAR